MLTLFKLSAKPVDTDERQNMKGATLKKDAKEKNDVPPVNVDTIIDESRQSMLEAIAKKNMEAEKDDFLPVDGDMIVEPKEGETQDTDKPLGEGVEPPKEPEPEEELVTVKIDGQERQVPISEIHKAGIAAYQKVAAADKRLEEATKLLKEAKAQRAKQEYDEGVKEPKEPKTREEIEYERSMAKAQDNLQHTIDDFANAQAYGTPDEIKKALVEYQNSWAEVNKLASQESHSQKVIDERVAHEINKREWEEQEKRNKEIMEQLHMTPEEGGYKDLLDDERTYQLMSFEVEKMLSEGAPNRLETYTKVGDSLREFLGIKVKPTGKESDGKDGKKGGGEPPPKQQPESTLAAKHRRKVASADHIETSGSIAPGALPDGPKTREQIKSAGIAHLRALRGQTI